MYLSEALAGDDLLLAEAESRGGPRRCVPAEPAGERDEMRGAGPAVARTEAGQGNGRAGCLQQPGKKGAFVIAGKGQGLDLGCGDRQPVDMPAQRFVGSKVAAYPRRQPARTTRRTRIGIPARQQARGGEAACSDLDGPVQPDRQNIGAAGRDEIGG